MWKPIRDKLVSYFPFLSITANFLILLRLGNKRPTEANNVNWMKSNDFFRLVFFFDFHLIYIMPGRNPLKSVSIWTITEGLSFLGQRDTVTGTWYETQPLDRTYTFFHLHRTQTRIKQDGKKNMCLNANSKDPQIGLAQKSPNKQQKSGKAED